jgi:hypothetical protein
MRIPRILIFPVLLLALCGALLAQGTSQVSIRIQQGTDSYLVNNGATVPMNSTAIGVPQSLSVVLTYRGNGSLEFQALDLFGSSDFVLTDLPTGAYVLTNGQNLIFGVRFNPTSGTRALAQLSAPFRETLPVVPGSPPQGVVGTIALNFSGGAPEIQYAFFLQNDANLTTITNGGAILFPPTQVNTFSAATFVILNRGSAPATVDTIAGGSAIFQLLGLPLLPGQLAAGQDVRFSIRYQPKEIATHSASLEVQTLGKKSSFKLEGSATGSLFSYELLSETDAGSTVLEPGATLTFADTDIGKKSTLSVRVRNVGNGDGVVTAVGIVGQGFAVTDIPILPITLTPNSAFILTVTFTPIQAGKVNGRVRISNDEFLLAGTGVGVQLVYTYTAGNAISTVIPGGIVSLTPARVGQSSVTMFSVENKGNLETTLSNISVTAAASPFGLENVPALPVTIPAGGIIQFGIRFSPSASGLNADVLRLDAQLFTLNGFGQSLGLPSYRFEGPSGVVEPLQQLSLGLTLNAPYPASVRGTLTLNLDSDSFSTDPAVQFSTGGRTATFVIPANTTQAIFANDTPSVKLQTGTVAGTITITPAFVSETGVDLTGSSPLRLTLTVPSLAPRLVDLRTESITLASFNLVVTGYATSRTLQKLAVTMKPLPNIGATVQGTAFTVEVEPVATIWYRGQTSQSFGGLFTLTIPVSVQGLADLQAIQTDPTKPLTLGSVFESISVSATNERGTSNTLVLSFSGGTAPR